MSRLLVALAAAFLTSPLLATPRVAIIIDDLGYQLSAGKRAIALPGPVAFAVLPSTPRGSMLADLAHRQGKDVILHLPLQATDHDGPPEPSGIMLDTDRDTFRRTFATAMASVPHAIGVSSHRGSLLTRHPGHMAWLMEELHQYGDLFFVDSYTTADSVALDIALEAGISAARRDVFLDHDRSEAAIARAFARLIRLAQERGSAIGIGHPYPETLTVLERLLPELNQHGIQLVSLSRLVLADDGHAAKIATAQGKPENTEQHDLH